MMHQHLLLIAAEPGNDLPDDQEEGLGGNDPPGAVALAVRALLVRLQFLRKKNFR
jgi:hypothetical protein